MAAYDAEKTIVRAIQSVVDQTYENWELLVINDCSKDNTVEVVRSFSDPRIKLYQNPVNYGVSKTRKVGLDAAAGEWIAILDSDDAWTTDKLEKQMALASSTGAELIFTGSAFMNNEGEPIEWILHVPERIEYRELLKQNVVSNSSVLVRTDLYRSYFAIGDGMHEDFAIWLGMTRDGHTAYGIDEPLLIYRLSSASKSSNKLKAVRMNWKTYRYMGLSVPTALYYMCWYAFKGLRKYKNLKR